MCVHGLKGNKVDGRCCGCFQIGVKGGSWQWSDVRGWSVEVKDLCLVSRRAVSLSELNRCLLSVRLLVWQFQSFQNIFCTKTGPSARKKDPSLGYSRIQSWNSVFLLVVQTSRLSRSKHRANFPHHVNTRRMQRRRFIPIVIISVALGSLSSSNSSSWDSLLRQISIETESFAPVPSQTPCSMPTAFNLSWLEN
mgnify:CR=1 FL=1